MMGFVGGVGVVNIDLLYSGADHIPAMGEEVFAPAFGMYLGGGIPATLVNLARLGVEARILTFLGPDFFSDFARREFKAMGAEVVNHWPGRPAILIPKSTPLPHTAVTIVEYSMPSAAARAARAEP